MENRCCPIGGRSGSRARLRSRARERKGRKSGKAQEPETRPPEGGREGGREGFRAMGDLASRGLGLQFSIDSSLPPGKEEQDRPCTIDVLWDEVKRDASDTP